MPRNIDPQRVFISGEAFLEVCRVLVESINAGNPCVLTMTLAVNSALTLEIFLKCLLLLETGSTWGGHDVHKLFHHLPADTQAELTAAHDKFVAANPRFGARGKVATDLESLLIAGRNTFVGFRYAYEKIPTGTDWGLNGFIGCVRIRILKLHPDWAEAFRNPQPKSRDH